MPSGPGEESLASLMVEVMVVGVMVAGVEVRRVRCCAQEPKSERSTGLSVKNVAPIAIKFVRNLLSRNKEFTMWAL